MTDRKKLIEKKEESGEKVRKKKKGDNKNRLESEEREKGLILH